MAERRNDNNGMWAYMATKPGMNLKLNPIALNANDGDLVESVGTDGRYLGAIRPFPGMGDSTLHGIPIPSGSTTITSISNIEFAKYVSIQKGTSNHVFKGICYIASNQAGTGKAIYFAYRDSQTGSADVVMLEDFNSWVDFKMTNILDYDITSNGRYIYFVASADTTSTVTTVSGKEAPYNKAYFWDFKVNSWDTFSTGFKQRFMSILPDRVLGVLINAETDGSGQSSSTSAYETIQRVTNGSAYTLPSGNYTFGVILVSRKHGLRSRLRLQMKNPIGAGATLVWKVYRTALLEATRQIANSIGADPAVAHAWGMSHWDGIRLYRTVVDDVFDTIGASEVNYSTVSPLYVEHPYLERFQNSVLLDDEDFHVAHVPIVTGIPAIGGETVPSVYMQDSALVQQEQYDFFLHDFGPAPRFKRLVSYSNMLVGVTDVREPTSFTTNWTETDRYPESFSWSIVTQNPPEPENFPSDHIYPLDDPSERVFSLETAGDFLFAVSNAAIYRIVRSGAQLVINKLQYRIGGVSRFGQVGVGNSLFVLTRSGLKEVDGNSGEIRSVTTLDRLIFDESEWGHTLGSVRMSYDAYAGCLILLNTSKKECILLWESSGAITKLEDCPWAYLTHGPDVLSDGSTRAFFVTSSGLVHIIDSARQMGKRSMCGVAAGETVNGVVTTGATSTAIHDTTATFPLNCVGFKAHILSGARTGDIGTITARVSATQLTVTGLGGNIAVGDRYSIAPVVTRIVWPQLHGDGGEVDPFVAKIGVSLNVAFSDLGGETSGSDVNAKVILGFKRGFTTLHSAEASINAVPDQCWATVNYRDTRLFPFAEFKGGNVDFELQALMVRGQLTRSEAQTAQA